eukprot:TRINITY_DN113154_c0_g1_i1.p1 TRINITY_DN113154_c0_g1~~TRINITY_DN113154_c0_g1_i1.p1  ORF type:complete len:485 (-),score=30.77 TRINITY_DN113154_c0_g1_i1:52-1506(-)
MQIFTIFLLCAFLIHHAQIVNAKTKVLVALKGELREYAYMSEENQLEGFLVDFTQEMLSKTEYEPVMTLYRGDWDELIKDIEHGRYDLAAASIFVTTDRASRVKFTPYIFLHSWSLLQHVPEQISWNGVFLPFNLPLWLAVIACHFFIGIAIWLAEVTTPEKLSLNGLLNGLWFSFMLPFGPPLPPPKTYLGRAAVVAWKFMFLAVVTAYVGYLTANITVYSANPQLKSVKDLRDEPVAVVNTMEGAASSNLDLRKLVPIPNNDLAAGIHMVLNKTVSAYLRSSLTKEAGENSERCDLMEIQLPGTTPSAFAVAHNRTAFRQVLATEILRLRNDDDLEVMRKKWFPSLSACTGLTRGNDFNTQQWTLSAMGGVFLLFLIGCTIVLLGLIRKVCVLAVTHGAATGVKPKASHVVDDMTKKHTELVASLKEIQKQIDSETKRIAAGRGAIGSDGGSRDTGEEGGEQSEWYSDAGFFEKQSQDTAED